MSDGPSSENMVVNEGHLVVQGECLNSISEKYGFFWRTLWDWSENSELKSVRKDPNVLAPGDRVFIPEKHVREESCAHEQKHRFRRKGVPSRLVMEFTENQQPRANEPYVVVIDGRHTVRGKTDSDGRISVMVPNGAREAELTLGSDDCCEIYLIRLGGLDPYDTPSGVRARLHNLGYDVGGADGNDSFLKRAIRQFQASGDLEPTGELDESTCAKLRDRHGS